MFTLWYIYLGFQEFRRRGYFQWILFSKNHRQDNTLTAKSTQQSDQKPEPSKPIATANTDIPSSTAKSKPILPESSTIPAPNIEKSRPTPTTPKMEHSSVPTAKSETNIENPKGSKKSTTISDPSSANFNTSSTTITSSVKLDKPSTSESSLATSDDNLRCSKSSSKIDSVSVESEGASKGIVMPASNENDKTRGKLKKMFLAKEDKVFEEGGGEVEDDEEEEEYPLKIKDSKLLIAAETSSRRLDETVEHLTPDIKATVADKKKISFIDRTSDDQIQSPSRNSSASLLDESVPTEDIRFQQPNENLNAPLSSPARSTFSGRNRVLIEGSDDPMRCWLTDGDHPDHPVGESTAGHNIKLLSNRTRDSADSILRDSDEFLVNERHISRQLSLPKKVSISEDPPTTFIRDIPPADDTETQLETSPAAKLKRETELAAAAAAALKEDWRKKMEKKSKDETETDDADEETIIFGDSDENSDAGGQILEISDDDDDEEEDLSDDSLIANPVAKYSKMVDAAVLEKLETGYKKLQASDSKSLLKKYLTQEIFDKLKNLKTPTFGSTLLDVIQSGLENHDSGVGIYAPDAEAYTVFADLFDPIIEDYHGGFKKTDKHPAKDFGDVDCFTNLDPAGEYIISTRVRCGRSMEGYPFNPCLTEAQYKEMEEKVSRTLSGLTGELKGNFYPLTGMTKEVQQKLIDDHFLFKEGDRFLQAANACRFWPTGRGIYHNDNKTFLVWCNEEDHLRIISMQMGGDLGQIYRRLVCAVNEIEKRVPFSHNDRLGFLTFCPTNLGTTIRASVHIKVPKLAANRSKLEEIAGKFNLQVRGTRGEHTEAEGGVYDISNKRRMGLTEFQAVKEMNDGIAELIKIEREL